ncbi:MAG: ABC transporter permease, partial [Clostridia bacterium]|nr:ABC transporter permease [Clostridia bacterium]
TSKDRTLINYYIEKNSENNAEIFYDDAQENLQESERVDDKGNRIIYREVNSTRIIANENNKKFVSIKSALPFKNSFKMGVSTLKVKLFRLILTIILSTAAFAMFGVVATFADFDTYTSMSNTIIDNQIDYINVKNDISNGPSSPTASYNTQKYIRNSDMENLLQLNPNVKFLKVYSGVNGSGIYYGGLSSSNLAYYTKENLTGITEVDMSKEEFLSTYGFTMTGELPQADNEVAITKYTFEHFKRAGLPKGDGYETITNEVDLIGERIMVNSSYLKVTGIIDTNLNADYQKLKKVAWAPRYEDADISKSVYLLNNDVKYGFHYLAFVNNGYIEKNVVDNKYVINEDNIELDFVANNQTPDELNRIKSSRKFLLETAFSNSDYFSKVFFDSSKTQLEANEVLLPYGFLGKEVRQQILNNIEQRIWDYCNDIDNVPQEIKNMTQYELNYNFDLDNHYQYYCVNNIPTDRDYSKAYYCWIKEFSSNSTEYGNMNALIIQINDEEIVKAFLSTDFDASLYLKKSNFQTLKDIKIVGCFLQSNYAPNSYLSNFGSDSNIFDHYTANYEALITEDLMNELGLETYGIYSSLVGNVPPSEKEIVDLTKSVYTYSQCGDSYVVCNDASDEVNEISMLLSFLVDTLLYVAIGLAVFAMILMMNYISTSISHKKKEIGVLRALGARGIDIFGIFINEAMIIAAINSVLSIVASAFAILGVNLFYRNKMMMNITVYHFGILQILLILGACILATSLASFLPVYIISRKRPIEAIRNK